MATEPIAGLPYPVSTDAPNGPLAFQNLAEAVAKKGMMVFASVAARLAALPSPTEGMCSYLADTDQVEVYTTAGWTNINYLLGTQPRGLIYGKKLNDESFPLSNIANDQTTHTFFTTPSLTLPAGRAYQLQLQASVISNASNPLPAGYQVALGVVQTSISAIIGYSGPRALLDNGWAHAILVTCILIPATTLTTSFAATARLTHAPTVAYAYDVKALATSPFIMTVTDIGLGSLVV